MGTLPNTNPVRPALLASMAHTVLRRVAHCFSPWEDPLINHSVIIQGTLSLWIA